MDPGPDPGGPKTYGSYGSGSATLVRGFFFIENGLLVKVLPYLLERLVDGIYLLTGTDAFLLKQKQVKFMVRLPVRFVEFCDRNSKF
jgi:hypothetical protein